MLAVLTGLKGSVTMLWRTATCASAIFFTNVALQDVPKWPAPEHLRRCRRPHRQNALLWCGTGDDRGDGSQYAAKAPVRPPGHRYLRADHCDGHRRWTQHRRPGARRYHHREAARRAVRRCDRDVSTRHTSGSSCSASRSVPPLWQDSGINITLGLPPIRTPSATALPSISAASGSTTSVV